MQQTVLCALGFGQTHEFPAPTALQQVNMNWFPTTYAKHIAYANTLDTIQNNMLFTYSPGGERTGHGDSGGPLIYKNPSDNRSYLTGVISFACDQEYPGCNNTWSENNSYFPTGYTNVYAFIPWMQSIISSPNSTASPMIIRGGNASQADTAFTVMLTDTDGNQLCGGSLINGSSFPTPINDGGKLYVLSAGHCLTTFGLIPSASGEPPQEPFNISLAYNLNSSCPLIPVTKVYYPEGFQSATEANGAGVNDITLLEIDSDKFYAQAQAIRACRGLQLDTPMPPVISLITKELLDNFYFAPAYGLAAITGKEDGLSG